MELIQANKIYEELCKTTFVHKKNNEYNVFYNVLHTIWEQNSMSENTEHFTERCAKKIMIKMYDFYNDSERKFDTMDYAEKRDIFTKFANEELEKCKN